MSAEATETEVEVKVAGVPTKVKLRRLTWGEMNDVSRESTKFDPMKQTMEMDLFAFNERRVVAAVVSPESLKTRNSIRALAPEDGTKLVQALDELHGNTKEAEKNLKAP